MKALSYGTNIILNRRATEFAERHYLAIAQQTDRIFAILMPVQWIAAIIAAYVIAPRAWSGNTSYLHPHVYFAILGGGLISSLPTVLCLLRPGRVSTRYVVAVGQMLMSGVLIHLTGGRIETHFHIFGSLAFLSFYRDWRVLVPATLVTTADHLLRGWLYPWSIYGVLNGAEWRWLEHAGWVAFENIFLITACLRGRREIQHIAQRTAALHENEELYRTVIEQTHEGILLVDAHSNILECNEAFGRLLGYDTLTAVHQLKLADFDVTPDDTAASFAARAYSRTDSIMAERQYRRLDGTVVEVEVRLTCVTHDDKEVFCYVVKDITESKLADTQLKRLALIAEKTSNAVIVTDAQTRIQWVNEGFTDITGYTLAEVLGKSPGQLLQGPATDLETVKQIRTALANRQPFVGEIYNYGKAGREYWISISITPWEDADGVLQGFIAIEMETTERREMEEALRRAHDDMEMRINARTAELQCANDVMVREVNERKRAEGRLKDAQQFLRSVIDTDPNLIYVKDQEGCFTLANQALADFYGTSVEYLIGRTEADFNENTQEVIDRFNEDWQVLETLQEKIIPEEHLTDYQGTVRWLQTVKRPLLAPNGIAQHILTISTDLTERRILESQLRHSQKLESIGQLAAGIAHEINTPTQYVGDNTRFVRDSFDEISRVISCYQELQRTARQSGFAGAVLDRVEAAATAADIDYLIEEIPTALQQSLEGVARIARIVQSMKDFAHPGTSEKKAADLNRAIESTLTVARNEWKYVAEIETRFDTNLPLVPCLLGAFNQVILNVVINATHAIEEVVGDGGRGKGKIIIETQNVNEQWAEVRITDSGKGIPPEIRGRIFDPFFTTKEVGKGTGQGLAISHSVIVEKHGGQLSFESEPGQGTTFIIRLPLHPEELENVTRSMGA